MRGAAPRLLKRTFAGLALPDGAADKLRQPATQPGVATAPPAHPTQASLGDAILVRGFDASADAVPAGGTLEVTYHFTAAKPLPPGWRLFFHLEGPVGYRNLDHVPVDGLMPLERWRPGQIPARPPAHSDPSGYAGRHATPSTSAPTVAPSACR